MTSADQPEVQAKPLGLKKMTVRIKGMSCAACSIRIEKALAKVPGVQDARVNLAVETATVEYLPEAVTPEQIFNKIMATGYRPVLESIELKISGMSCAACSARIEKGLNKLPGVARAAVNLATEKAVVEFNPAEIEVPEIRKAVEHLGYRATPAEDREAVDSERAEREREIKRQKSLVIFSAILSAPLLVNMLVMVFNLHHLVPAFFMSTYFQFALATPIQFIAGANFYKEAYGALRSRSANMSVLVVLGTSAAYVYSVVATFFGDRIGVTEVYYETSAIIITLVLLGKTLEAIAKGRTSEAH